MTITPTVNSRRPFTANGLVIKRARKSAQKSQAQLAAEAGTTRRHMIRLENGEHLPGRELRGRIAQATGVEARTILAADEDEDESLPRRGRGLSEDLHRLAELAGLLERRPDLLAEVATAADSTGEAEEKR